MFLGAQLVVAPLHGGAKRLVPGKRGLVPGEETEPVVQPGADLIHGKQLHARRGQLDRQRNAVETPTDLSDDRAVLRIEREARLRRARPIHEEMDGIRRLERLPVVPGFRPGSRERAHRKEPLPVDAQPFSAGCQDLQSRRSREQRLAQLRAGGKDVLAVVEDEQGIPGREMRREAFPQRPARLFLDPQSRGDGDLDSGCILDRREIDEPDAVGVASKPPLGELECYPRLSASADPGEREDPVLLQEPGALAQLPLAADEAGAGLGEIVSRRSRSGRDAGASRSFRRFDLDPGIADVAKPEGRILLQATGQQTLDAGRSANRERPGVRLGVEHCAHGLRRGIAREGPSARETLIHYAAEREDIGALILALAADLLRAHVAGRARHGAHVLAVRERLLDGRSPGVSADPQPAAAGQAEVEQLHAAFRSEHDVAGLEVPMHDTLGMSGSQRRRDLAADLQRVLHRDGAGREARRERLAFHALQDQEPRPIVSVLQAMDGGDVGMVERSRQLRLAQKAGAPVGIRRKRA